MELAFRRIPIRMLHFEFQVHELTKRKPKPTYEQERQVVLVLFQVTGPPGGDVVVKFDHEIGDNWRSFASSRCM